VTVDTLEKLDHWFVKVKAYQDVVSYLLLLCKLLITIEYYFVSYLLLLYVTYYCCVLLCMLLITTEYYSVCYLLLLCTTLYVGLLTLFSLMIKSSYWKKEY